MREIKFRAWDKATGNWLEAITYTLHTSGRLLITPRNVELMQYTGLHDKNGKEIYEGDFLRVDWRDSRYPVHTIGPVTWDVREARWIVGEGGTAQDDAGHYMEVIGNMYEDPELLKD